MNLAALCKGLQLEPGDIVGVTDPGPIAVALRHRTAGPGEGLFHMRVASHVAQVVGCHQGGGLDLIEATPPQVRPSRETDIRGKVCFVWRPKGLDVDKAIAYLHAHEGDKYDLPAIPALFGIGKQTDNMKYCSELLGGRPDGGSLCAGGYPIPFVWAKIMVTPWDMQMHAHATGELVYSSEKEWW